MSVQLGGLGAAGLRTVCWVAGGAEAGSFASERSPAQVAPAGVAVFSFTRDARGCQGQGGWLRRQRTRTNPEGLLDGRV